MRLSALAAASLLPLLGACALPHPAIDDTPVEVIEGSVPLLTETPTSRALACLGTLPRQRDIRVAVGDIPDRTGRFDYEDLGSFVTQGATFMMMSALSEAGVPQVNRSTVGIAEWELEQAINQRLGEGRPVSVGNQVITYRPVQRGAITGSTHYITGAITELDFNVFDRVNEVSIGGIGGGIRTFVARIGIDIAVTDTRTTEVVLARSLRKQVAGYEVVANIFRIFDIGGGWGQIEGDELIDVSFASAPTEPLQGSVRWVIENAAYDIASTLLGTGTQCDEHLNETVREDRKARYGITMAAAAQSAPAPGPAAIGDVLDTRPPEEGQVNGNITDPAATPLDCRFIAGRRVCANFPDNAPAPGN